MTSLEIPGLTYLPDYLSPEEQAELIRIIDNQAWRDDLETRRVQQYGWRYDYKARRVDESMRLGPLPDWARELAEKLHADGHIAYVLDQVIVNEYEPGQGISQHTDCVPCFDDTIISLSLNSGCVMEFLQPKVEEVVSLYLAPGSLLVLRGEARYEWKHRIPARKKDFIEGKNYQRERRISLTFRRALVSNAVTLPAKTTGAPLQNGKQGAASALPFIIQLAGKKTQKRFIEFFTANIRNVNTRQAYLKAVVQFMDWCEECGISFQTIEPIQVATYIEKITQERAPQTVKQHLAAIRMLFDWMVVGQEMPFNPAASVRGPKYSIKKGKTPVLSRADMRKLLDSIDVSHVVGLRDRALIGLMVYSFARVSAVVNMKVRDYYANGKRWWIRLHEKGGKFHEVPVHHLAEEYLDAYLQAAAIGEEKNKPLFRTTRAQTRILTEKALNRVETWKMIKRRALTAGLSPVVTCHTFRATGITAYLENGGTIEHAQQIAAHESPRTTKLYDRTSDAISLDEIERIVI